MRIRFWAVRGSVPTPLMLSRVRATSSSTIQRIASKDIESQEARELFLARCRIISSRRSEAILPASRWLPEERCRLHLRCRHGYPRARQRDPVSKETVGLPYILLAFPLGPYSRLALRPRLRLSRTRSPSIAPSPSSKAILEGQMKQPYFPISRLDVMAAAKHFRVLLGDRFRWRSEDQLSRDEPSGRLLQLRHRGERDPRDLLDRYRAAGRGLSANPGEYWPTSKARTSRSWTRNIPSAKPSEKYNWGHSSFSLASDFAATWGIKRLVLFHHEPSNSDLKVESIFKSASWYVDHLESKGIEVFLAREGLEIEI